jgi:hypothetical protein
VSKRDKSEEKIRNNPGNVSLGDFEALINRYGYIKEGGKHPQAVIGMDKMPYKRENPVKSAYVKQLLSFIDRL